MPRSAAWSLDAMVRCRPLTESTVVSTGARIALRGRLSRADRELNLYAYLPFEVPPGVAAIRVTLDHDPPGNADDPGRGAVLDLGLMGPGHLDFGAPAFRGWSGSERRTVLVGTHNATPGYRSGAIESGRWHVMLGLYGIPPGGCDYDVEVDLLEREPFIEPRVAAVAPARGRPRAKAAATIGHRWIPCDLHAHSVHSDGADEITALADAAGRTGLEVLFVTDHNTDSHHPYLAAAGEASGVVLLAGEEVTTYGGHFNALGIRSWVDFRHRTPGQVDAAFAATHAQGGLISLNHPASDGSPWSHGRDLPFDLVEVWNGPWRTENAAALEWWTTLLRDGRRTTAVGGSDMHSMAPRGQPIGTPVTWVRAASSGQGAILDGLRSGRVIVTRDSAVRLPELRLIHGDGAVTEIGAAAAMIGPVGIEWRAANHRGRQLALVSGHGAVAVSTLGSADARGGLRLDAREAIAAGHVRLEIREDEALIAVTNPIFLEAP
jgi:predicted metal-dependent phosphoesterase TrpH